MTENEHNTSRNRKRKPLTLHEKWRIDGELIRKSDPEYYDSEQFEKNFKANLERAEKMMQKYKEQK
ncbi:hypothetical protein [Staphylococcus arlettae]|uniref:hypothetical protein n=1 Tax=Staphylococcus arlettae TaxID=29378 RepID=UPI000D1A433C|nr:hypothetical protein [Staphylococcus arlettae]PTH22133.1 hypothetical protein BU602_09645 [Staphylococcus arlettae]